MKETKRKIIVSVLISVLVFFVGFVVYSFAPCKDTVKETFTFHTLDAGKIVANVSVEYTATPTMIYKSKNNQVYFRDFMKVKIREAIYKNFFDDVLKKEYLTTRNQRNVLSIEIIDMVGHIQYEKHEPIDFDDGKDIDVRDVDPTSSCWFEVKEVKCEIELDSMIEKRILEVAKLQEETERKEKELNDAKNKLKEIQEIQ